MSTPSIPQHDASPGGQGEGKSAIAGVDFASFRALLFLPASNERAIAKARGLGADLVILDLEDAVKPQDKARAREMAVAAIAEPWPMPVAIRVNGTGAPEHLPDLAAVGSSAADVVVLPMAESAEQVAAVRRAVRQPVIAMIESAAGVLAAPAIARVASALLVGTNDLAADLCLPQDARRQSLCHALQAVVLAARAARVAVYDGVYNRLDDAEGFAAEAAEGRSFGFDGKSLVHPSQLAPCLAAFSPTAEEIERAERLVAAATGGAERFEGQMIESMHVEAARRVLMRR